MSLLITGYRGYIGSHLIRNIKDASFCDLKDEQDFADLEGFVFDTVIHLAAHASVTQSLKDPDECFNNNTFKLISFLTKNTVKRFVFASTGGAIYGNCHFAKENQANWAGCISPYGQSKYLAEKIIRQLIPNHVILRLGNVWGGNDKDRLEAAAHAHFRTDIPITVYGGTQARDFVSIDVVCEAFKRAAESEITGTFNIGSGKETQVRHVAEKFSQERYVPIIYLPARAGEIEYVSLDVSKARGAGLIE
jgi:UDP-glucose 4-epimerase